MKKTVLPLSLTLILSLTSCMQQRDRTEAYSEGTGQYQFDSSNTSSNAEQSRANSAGASGTTTESTTVENGTTTTSTIPDGIRHCTWSMDGETSFTTNDNTHIGPHTLCQSKDDAKVVYIQVKYPIQNSQVCFIPTHNSGSKSIYVGEPRCLMLLDSKKIYKVQLYTNRTNYTSSSVTGVMVMKDKAYHYAAPFNQLVLAPDAYIFCSQFLDKYNHSGYCDAFKAKGEYLYRNF